MRANHNDDDVKSGSPVTSLMNEQQKITRPKVFLPASRPSSTFFTLSPAHRMEHDKLFTWEMNNTSMFIRSTIHSFMTLRESNKKSFSWRTLIKAPRRAILLKPKSRSPDLVTRPMEEKRVKILFNLFN
jgi:hypothetical protein